MSGYVFTVTQQWRGETFSVDHLTFTNQSYPIWLTIASMDMALYRDAGVVLPDRVWTSRPID